MPAIFRRLLTLLTAAALLLCFASAVMWARSYWVVDTVERFGSQLDPLYSTSRHTWRSSSGAVQWQAERMDYPENYYNSLTNAGIFGTPEQIRSRLPAWTWSGQLEPESMEDPAEPAILRSFRWRSHQRIGQPVGERRDEWSILCPWWALMVAGAWLPAARAIVRFRRRGRSDRKRTAASMRAAIGRVVGAMRRGVRSTVAAAPAAIFLLAAFGWVRSYWVQDELSGTTLPTHATPPLQTRTDAWESGCGVVAWTTTTEVWPVGTPSADRARSMSKDIARFVRNWSWDRRREPAPADASVSVPPAVGHFRWATTAPWVGSEGKQITESIVTFPWWAVAVAATPVPGLQALAWMRRRRTRARRAQGRCAACGYDLRATPERCPECGAAASPSSL